MAHYFESNDLNKFSTINEEVPEYWDAFLGYYGKVFEEGSLTTREKTLIGLAVAMAEKCPYCIDQYTQNCLNVGITEEQMTEVMHVTSAMKAGANLVQGVQIKNIVKKLEF